MYIIINMYIYLYTYVITVSYENEDIYIHNEKSFEMTNETISVIRITDQIISETQMEIGHYIAFNRTQHI